MSASKIMLTSDQSKKSRFQWKCQYREKERDINIKVEVKNHTGYVSFSLTVCAVI